MLVACPRSRQLDELSFAGDIELTFAPLFDEWPCFEGVRAYVAPDCSLDFACRAGKVCARTRARTRMRARTHAPTSTCTR